MQLGVDTCFLQGEAYVCISFTAPSHWQPHIICGRSSAYSTCLELRCSCSVPQLNSGGTRYLQWYIDSCFLLGERIMCAESPGDTRYLQWYADSCFLQCERIMCVESAGVTRYLQWYADSCFLQGERIMCVTLSLPRHTDSSTQSLADPHHVLHAL